MQESSCASRAQPLRPRQHSRGERAEQSLGNVDAHNPDFVGRIPNCGCCERLRRARYDGPAYRRPWTGGPGQDYALALEYAHAFAHQYGGGRWQIRCEGHDDLRVALISLAPALHIEFTEAEKPDLDLQFQRILTELRKLADAHEPHRCLLLLDNVDQPNPGTVADPAPARR